MSQNAPTPVAVQTRQDQSHLEVGAAQSDPVSQRLWFLDFLRAFAAIAVAVYHLGYFFWIYNNLAPSLWLANPIPDLHVAGYLRALSRFIAHSHFDFSQTSVAVFFLVSGFVIPLTLEQGSLRRFLVSRFFRLYPTYWVALAFTTSCLAASSFFNGRAFAYTFRDMLLNLTLFQDWVGVPLIDGVSWTLVIELKFYLLCALLFPFRATKSPVLLTVTAALLAMATFVAALLSTYAAQSGNSWFPIVCGVTLTNACRLIFILIGTALYRFWCRQWSWKVFLCTASTLIMLYSTAALIAQLRLPADGVTPTSDVIAAIIFCLVYLLRDKIPRLRAIKFAANMSYPFYLVHSLAGCAILSALYPYTHNMYLDLLLTVPVVTTVAFVIHRFVEKPSIALGRRVRASLP